MSRPFDPAVAHKGLFDALVDAAERYGWSKPILEDQERKPLTYLELVRGAFALGSRIGAMTRTGDKVAVMLPSSAGGVVTFFALHAYGRVPVMLNFTAGEANLRSACTQAGARLLLTSKRFVSQGKYEELVEALSSQVRVVWLEDVRGELGAPDKLRALIGGQFPKWRRVPVRPSAPGAILFTSGSFGAPKGVALSHCNLIANCEQIACHIDLDPDWVFFNPLPIFHAFGLVGTLLPLLQGLKVFEFPSPLRAKEITALLKETNTAVLMATDTFVNQYARVADADDFASLKFVVAGAEKVRDETHAMFRNRFGGVKVLEGYGATECSPVIAVNQPERNRPGTVGRVLPGIETRLEPVEGLRGEGGRLYVRGPNVMHGYLSPDDPDRLEPLPGGWHDTGDVVTFDDEDDMIILGRAKRFAKIAGEMISLTAVENIAAAVWPDHRHAVVSVPDARRGERLILVTDNPDARSGPLLLYAQRHGAPEIAVPKKVIVTDEIPVLGTGKTDYPALQRVVEAELSAGEEAA